MFAYDPAVLRASPRGSGSARCTRPAWPTARAPRRCSMTTPPPATAREGLPRPRSPRCPRSRPGAARSPGSAQAHAVPERRRGAAAPARQAGRHPEHQHARRPREPGPIRNALPVAFFDLAGIDGGPDECASRAASEPFTDLGSDRRGHPDVGEVVFVDRAGVVSARRWCWRSTPSGRRRCRRDEERGERVPDRDEVPGVDERADARDLPMKPRSSASAASRYCGLAPNWLNAQHQAAMDGSRDPRGPPLAGCALRAGVLIEQAGRARPVREAGRVQRGDAEPGNCASAATRTSAIRDGELDADPDQQRPEHALEPLARDGARGAALAQQRASGCA